MNSTKPLFRTVTLIAMFLTQAYSVSFGAGLPYQVQRLVEKRQQAISKIDNSFVDELEKIKTNYTKAGDLENANLVAELIKQTKSLVDKRPFALEGEWRYQTDGEARSVVRRFKDNQFFDQVGIKRDYVLTNDGITIWWNSSQFEKITLDPQKPDVMKGVNHTGARFTYTRVK